MKQSHSGRRIILISILLITVFVLSNVASAADTGWVSPTSNSGGSGVTSPQYAYIDDTSYASFNGGGSSNWNYYSYDFSSIPSGATINGIEVNAFGFRDSGSAATRYMRVRLNWNNGSGSAWTSYSTDTTEWTIGSPPVNHILGGTANTWGHSWTTNEIRNSFQIQTQWMSGSSSVDASLDHIPVRVNYTPGAASTYNISGYITNKTSGSAINGAHVEINTTPTPRSTNTNLTGYYNFSGISNGTYLISASASGYSSNSTVTVVNGNNRPNINISLTPTSLSQGVDKILVSTNRYVILDDPESKIGEGDSGTDKVYQTGFGLPAWSNWGSDDWTGAQTNITGYALVIDENGVPVSSESVSFTFKNWGNNVVDTFSTTTDAQGMASYLYRMDKQDYYGNWYVQASAPRLGVSDTAGFIYNWWGCTASGCQEHGNDGAPNAQSSNQNSPYTLGREEITSNNHHNVADSACVGCHRSYSGQPGGGSYSGQSQYTSDVHSSIPCSTCHSNMNQHEINAAIKSCDDASCHTRIEGDISDINTMPGNPARSNYSGGTGPAKYHADSAIPCIICHGPMHNITKPDESQRFINNNVTEEKHCTTCHMDTKHSQSNPVYCTACHSQDAHKIQVLGKDGTYKNRKSTGAITSNRTDCITCHTSGSPDNIFGNLTLLNPQAYSTNFDPAGKYYGMHPAADCTNSCHDTTKFHRIGEGGGGPDCLFCHNSSGSADHRVDGNAIESGIHANLNTRSTPNPNSKCWGCHDSTGDEPVNSMGDIFNMPYKCNDCHTSTGQKAGAYGAFIVDEHYPSGKDIKAVSGTSDLGACILCHNKTGMKVNYISPDNIDTNYSLVSHYGKNRSDIHAVNETNCAYCHQNISEFNNIFQDLNNTQITHNNMASCLTCHREKGSPNGRIHDSSLIGAGGPDCKSCHDLGNPGVLRHIDFSAAAMGEHGSINATVDSNGPCWACHQTDGKKPSGMGDRAYKPYLCPDCHLNNGVVSGIFNAPIVDEHFKNGSNITAATEVATDVLSCVKCHQKPGMIVPNNDPDNGTYDSDNNGIFGGSTNPYIYGKKRPDMRNASNETNCAYCHQNISEFNDVFQKASNTNITHNSGKSCYTCHRSEGSLDGRIHDASLIGGSGNACIACHSSSTGPNNNYPAIDIALFGNHRNINTTDGNDTLTDNDCEGCHYNISNMMNRALDVDTRICTDCHISGNFSAPTINNHKPPKVPVSVGGKISTIAYCSICHNNSINKYIYSVNASVSHYVTNESLVKTANQTPRPRFGFMTTGDAQQYNKECNNCHNPSNSSYGNATPITTGHIGRAICNECHVNGSASDLHNVSLGMPITFNCFECHTTYAAKYGAANLTGTPMAGYTTFCNGGSCHGIDNFIVSLNTRQRHNVDRNYAGTPGSTDTVYLNNNVSLTVTKGAIVNITSRINDTLKYGGASRIGGGEYYVDVDPGQGKGIPMDAVDGSYDALQNTWEPIKATIDTNSLSDGTHTIYVRGMDIGKQWSIPKSATLVVESLGYINGTVTNASTILSGVTVSTTGVSMITLADGKYSLMVPAGNYTVTATKQPTYYNNISTNVSVKQNTETSLPIDLRKKPTGNISGVMRIV